MENECREVRKQPDHCVKESGGNNCDLDVEPSVAFCEGKKQKKKKHMKIRKLQIAIMAGALLLAVQARATMYDITYGDGSNVGSGVLDATANGNGSFTVTGGNFTWTEGAYQGATASLVPLTAPVINGVGFSGTTFVMYGGTELFPVDNLIYPNQTSLLTPSGGVGLYAQTGGLAFNDPSFSGAGGSGLAFLLYANNSGGAGEYGAAFNGAKNEPYLDNYGGGTVTLSLAPVPEPTTMVAGAMLLLPFGMSTLRILRRKQTA
jgi:hypothetical protein